MSPSHWACYWIIVERMYLKASNVPNGARLNLLFFYQVSCYLIIFTTSFVDGVWFEALSWYQSHFGYQLACWKVFSTGYSLGNNKMRFFFFSFFLPGWCKISSLDGYGALMWIILLRSESSFHYLLYSTFMNYVVSLMDFD